MTDLALRPRSATEIIDLAVRLLRRHFVGFFTVALVGLIPNLVVQLLLRTTMMDGDPTTVVSRLGSITRITTPVSIVFGSLMIGSLLAYGDDALRTGTADVARAVSRGAARLATTIGVSILSTLASLIGLALLVVPGVYVSLRLATAMPAAVVEGDGVIAALRRAWARGDGHALHTLRTLLLLFLILLVMFVAIGIVDAVGAALLGGFRSGNAGGVRGFVVISQVLTTLASGVIYPLLTNVLLLLTYDLRVRREGYDVEAMAAALGTAA